MTFVSATVGELFAGMTFQNNPGVWTLQPTAASQKYAPPTGFEAWDVDMSNGPPITSAPVPPSIPGIVQPVFIPPGTATVPPPGPITGSPIIPPPPIANPVGYPVFPPQSPNTAPVTVPRGPLVGPAVGPAPVPPSIPGVQQPQFVPPGTATVPPTLFPGYFTTTPPAPPIVFANIAMIGPGNPPSTPSQNPPAIIPSPIPTIPQLPWNPPPTQPPPANTVRPLVTGTTVTGSNLTSTTGTWTDATTYARAWTRNGSPIAGATGTVYALVGADEGALIGVNVTATGPGGEASMDSLPVGPITPPPLEDTPPPEEDSEPTTLPSRAAPVHRAATKRKKR